MHLLYSLRIIGNQILHLQHCLLQPGRILFKCQHDLTAHHQSGHVVRTDFADLIGTHALSVAHDCRPVTDALDLIQLMRNKDDRPSIVPQLLKLNEQLFCLLRREHCRRFIQNQNICASIQRL